jgi:hypothetical protein
MEPVPQSSGEEMSRKIRAKAYIECSAKMQVNVKEVFDLAVRAAVHPEIEPAGTLPKVGKESDPRKRQVRVALLGPEAGKPRIDTFIDLSVRSLTNTQPSLRDSSVEFTLPFSRKTVNLRATRLDSPLLQDIAKYDFVIFLGSLADSNLVAGLDATLRPLAPSAAGKTGWIFVAVDREERGHSVEALSKLKDWAQLMNGQFVEASLRSGVGLHEVFNHIAKSWLGK